MSESVADTQRVSRGFATHKRRLGCIVIDRRTDNLDAAARFWAETLGLAVKDDRGAPLYRRLISSGDEVAVIVQKVEHESRVHLDIETDDQAAEVARLEKARRHTDRRHQGLDRDGSPIRPPLLRGHPATAGFRTECHEMGMSFLLFSVWTNLSTELPWPACRDYV